MKRNLKVLLGDSEGWSVDLFTQAAASFGVELRHARNGVEAIEMFKTLSPALVVLDTMLPKLDGLQAAARIREMELGRITPIIVSSGIYRRGPDSERLRQRFGFTDFLEKPFRLEDIVQLFGEYLQDEIELPAAESDIDEDGEPVRLPAIAETPLTELGVPALLCQLFRGRKTGILTLRQGEITKVLFFERGHVTHARSNSKRDRLGRVLLRNKKITLEDYQRARRLQSDSSGMRQLGAALVNLGVLSENDVVNAVSSQILSIVFGLFAWREGTWSFLETRNVPADYSRFHFNTPNLIFWGLRQLEGREDFARLLPNGRVLIERPPDAERLKESLHLTYFEDQILNLVDGRRRLSEVVAIGRLAQVDVGRVLFSLLVLGVLQLSPVGAGSERTAGRIADEVTFDAKGTLLQTSIARLSSRIHLAGLSGRLTVRREDGETEVHFDRGEIVSARSSRDEFRLGRILLRAGKVTQDEYDQVMRNLIDQTHKRVGRHFLEMRALSLEDLDWALRFQVQAIVLDLFHWRDGDYSFDEGEPPADMLVTLEATTPNLIMEGVRSTPAPPGIVGLLHNPDALLVRVWDEDRLTRILRLSGAERRLLSYIESGRTMREIRSLGVMSEDELSRAVHGLLALEVVRLSTSGPMPRSEEEVAAPFATDPVDDPAMFPDLGEGDTPLPLGDPARDEPGSVDVELTGEFRFDAPNPTVPTVPTERDKIAAERNALRIENEQLRNKLAALAGELRRSGRRPENNNT